MKYSIKEVWQNQKGKEWTQEHERDNNMDIATALLRFLQQTPWHWQDGFDTYTQKQFTLMIVDGEQR